MDQQGREIPHTTFKSPPGRPRRGGFVRLLAVSVSLSILSAGILGLVASQFDTARPAASVADALRAGEGSRVWVRGLLGGVREVAGGAAISSLTDCAGRQMTVFFEEAPPKSLGWRLVTLDATVKTYRGALELSVAPGARAETVPEPAAVVDASALLTDWHALRCHAVAVHGPVLWARPSEGDPLAIDIGVYSAKGNLEVLAHTDVYLEVTLNPGASVTFVGVVADAQGGKAPVLHVRV
jgi:hypothetical protein